MNNNKTLAVTAIFVFFFCGLLPLQGRQTFNLKQDVHVAKDEVQDNVISLGGNVEIEGRVKQTVIAFGGTITVSGEVGQSVVGIGSAVLLKSTAVVRRDVVTVGGTLTREPGCVINGDTVYLKASEIGPRLFKQGIFKGLFSFPLAPIILIIKLISIFLWFLAALAVAAIFPKQLAFASSQITKSFWPVVGVGILAMIVFGALVIFSALLCLILIGIPMLFALVWAGLIIKVFGRVVLFYFFGESLLRAFGSQRITPIGASLLGLLLVSFIGLIPFLGFLFTFCLSIIGWGVIARTRFGTTENWLTKR